MVTDGPRPFNWALFEPSAKKLNFYKRVIEGSRASMPEVRHSICLIWKALARFGDRLRLAHARRHDLSRRALPVALLQHPLVLPQGLELER